MASVMRKGTFGDAAAGLGLHFLHMSEGPFSHDAGHIYYIYITILNKHLSIKL